MFKHILVPLDGSARAERAIPLAARIAHASGGSMLLLQVVSTLSECGMYAMEPSVLMLEALAKDLATAAGYLAQIAKSKELAGIDTHIAVFSGTAAVDILDVARSQHANLIVMCSHGNTGFKRWMMGSVTQKVARSSPVPVLMLRDGGYVPSGPYPDPNRPLRALRVLVALDGSAYAEAAIVPAAQLAAALAAPARGTVHLTRVVKWTSADSERHSQDQKSLDASEKALYEAETYLSSVANHLREDVVADLNLTVTWSVTIAADVAAGLIRAAEKGEDVIHGGYDIIALATHGHGGLPRWVMGSVTEQVLGATQLPLLIIRSQSSESRGEETRGATEVVKILTKASPLS